MRTITRRIQPNRGYPFLDQSAVLPSCDVWRCMQPTREQILVGFQFRLCSPGCDGIARLLGHFELHRVLGLLLHDHSTRGDPITLRNVADAQLD